MNTRNDIDHRKQVAMYNQPCLSKIRSHYPSLFEAEQKVADYIIVNSEECLNLTIAELAKRARVAASTVNRFCQSLGYEGFKDFKLELAKDLVTPIHLSETAISKDDNMNTIKEKIIQTDIQGLADTSASIDPVALEKAVAALVAAKKIYIYGVGSAVAIAMDLFYWMSRIGIVCQVCNDPNIQKISASLSDENTVSIGISHSGVTRTVVQSLTLARERGSTCIAYTNFAKSPIAQVSDIVLLTATKDTSLRNVSMISRVAHLVINDLLVLGVAHKMLNSAENALKTSAEALIAEKLINYTN